MANRIAIPPVNARPLTVVAPVVMAAPATQITLEGIRAPDPPLSMIPLATATCTGEIAALDRARRPELWIEDLAFEFEVSSDEEYVRLRVSAGGRSFDMGARAHHYMLLLLARARLADAAARHRDSSCGWVYQDEFSRDPSLGDPQINVHIFRARRQFIVKGVADGERLIERRPQTRQLRIGASRISIVTR